MRTCLGCTQSQCVKNIDHCMISIGTHLCIIFFPIRLSTLLIGIVTIFSILSMQTVLTDDEIITVYQMMKLSQSTIQQNGATDHIVQVYATWMACLCTESFLKPFGNSDLQIFLHPFCSLGYNKKNSSLFEQSL